MSLITQIQAGFTRVGTEIKTVRSEIAALVGDKTALTTTAKGTIVAAINELETAVVAAASSGGAAINDAASGSSTTYSSTKINAVATAAASAAAAALVNGAGTTMDTLKELGDLITGDETAAAALATTVGSKVPQTRLVNGHALSADITLVLADISDAQSATAVGSVTTDFAASFTAALA
jgi:hypothetical protein